jgi:hypothetical protein
MAPIEEGRSAVFRSQAGQTVAALVAVSMIFIMNVMMMMVVIVVMRFMVPVIVVGLRQRTKCDRDPDGGKSD